MPDTIHLASPIVNNNFQICFVLQRKMGADEHTTCVKTISTTKSRPSGSIRIFNLHMNNISSCLSYDFAIFVPSWVQQELFKFSPRVVLLRSSIVEVIKKLGKREHKAEEISTKTFLNKKKQQFACKFTDFFKGFQP